MAAPPTSSRCVVEAPQQVVALLGLLDRRPVSAAAQHLDPAPGDPLADLPHRLRRRDRVLVAGDEQRRAGDLATRRRAARRRAPRRCARSRPGDWRISELAHEARRPPGASPRVSDEVAACTSASAIACMPASPSLARLLAARPDAGRGSRRAGRAAGRRGRGCATSRGSAAARWNATMVPSECATTCARSTPAAPAHAQHRLHEALDRQRPLDPARAAEPGRSGRTRLVTRERRHHRRPDVGRCRRGRGSSARRRLRRRSRPPSGLRSGLASSVYSIGLAVTAPGSRARRCRRSRSAPRRRASGTAAARSRSPRPPACRSR